MSRILWWPLPLLLLLLGNPLGVPWRNAPATREIKLCRVPCRVYAQFVHWNAACPVDRFIWTETRLFEDYLSLSSVRLAGRWPSVASELTSTWKTMDLIVFVKTIANEREYFKKYCKDCKENVSPVLADRWTIGERMRLTLSPGNRFHSMKWTSESHCQVFSWIIILDIFIWRSGLF